jgi:hypothetical protein
MLLYCDYGSNYFPFIKVYKQTDWAAARVNFIFFRLMTIHIKQPFSTVLDIHTHVRMKAVVGIQFILLLSGNGSCILILSSI